MTSVSGGALPLIVTQGDPAGIGIEITGKAWAQPGMPAFALLADPAHVRKRFAQIGLQVPIAETNLDRVAAVFCKALPVLPSGFTMISEPGQSRIEDALGTIDAIETAVHLIRQGRARAIVTNPIAKDMLYRAGFPHPGHTEFLGELSKRHWGQTVTPVMMLWCEELAVIPVTVHIALADVPRRLTREGIVETVRIAAQDLKTRFGLARPRIAILGLNPHAGESGTIGAEETWIIEPAIAELRKSGYDIQGPCPADTMFHPLARKTYDVAIAMYHDQGLIPVKTLAFDEAVNVTLGLPFIRTAPDHGTAFDIASKGIARADSLIAALRLADRLARAQAASA